MIGMHESTGIAASFRQTKAPLNALSNSCATLCATTPIMAHKGSAIDNPALIEATFGCCVGRIGADRKGNAHLR
jgi:hypothetical protein